MKSAKANYSFPHEAIVLVVQLGTQLIEKDGEYFLAFSELKNRKVHDNYDIKMKDTELNSKKSAYSLGTGFFVKPNIIVTAAHVLLEPNKYQDTAIENIRFINCYHEPLDIETIKGEQFLHIDKANIFKPIDEKLREGYYDYSATAQDWAFVPVENEIGRPIAEGHCLKVNNKDKEGEIKEKDEVSWYGHPLGLPLSTISNNKGKSDIKKVIKKINSEGVFEIKNTAYPGLSGAPVLKHDKVVGIVVRGMSQLEIVDSSNSVFISQPDMDDYEGAECQVFDTALMSKLNTFS